MTGKEPTLKPTALLICKGYSPRSLQVNPLLSVLMISVVVAELKFNPVDTKIMGSEKKGKVNEKSPHNSHWVKILALDQHRMKECLPKVYNLHNLIFLYKTQDHITKFLKTEIHIKMNVSSLIIEKKNHFFFWIFSIVIQAILNLSNLF